MSDNFGYFSISRKLKDNFLYPQIEGRKFTKYEAWIWFFENANFFCEKKIFGFEIKIIPRGYLITTVSQLTNIFRWDRRSVEKFLIMLENEQQIKRFKLSKSFKSCTLIKVNNYNAFQLPVDDLCKLKYKLQCKSYCKTQCKLRYTPNKEVKEVKEVKEERAKFFTPPSIEEVSAYCAERNNRVNPERFVAFYSSKGWFVGSNKMKDWKSAIRTWEVRDREEHEAGNSLEALVKAEKAKIANG